MTRPLFIHSVLAASLLSLTCAPAHADEHLWVNARGADALPRGAFEARTSDITGVYTDSGDYVFHDIRGEVEYGLTNSLAV